MTQTRQILEHLQSGNTITAIDALARFKCFRLAARIKDIKDMGYNVISRMVEVDSGKRIARYWMV